MALSETAMLECEGIVISSDSCERASETAKGYWYVFFHPAGVGGVEEVLLEVPGCRRLLQDSGQTELTVAIRVQRTARGWPRSLTGTLDDTSFAVQNSSFVAT